MLTWSGQAPNLTWLCNLASTGGALALYCRSSGGSLPASGISIFDDPGPGLLFYLWTSQSTTFWDWNVSGGGSCPDAASGTANWWCQGGNYAIPYFCSFSEVSCLQPVTLTQLSYVAGPYNPCFIQVSQENCSGYPGSVTLTPA
ncbi:MAG TPA: hypothetical protein VEI07_15475 [Planctomycetaceae bacterium]|nr:hypothetical protein [Planctomycetaceae bacterium]